MTRYRARRIVWPSLWLAIIIVAAVAALHFLVGTLLSEGMTPAAVFGLLLVLAAVALLWRAVLNLRKTVRRVRG